MTQTRAQLTQDDLVANRQFFKCVKRWWPGAEQFATNQHCCFVDPATWPFSRAGGHCPTLSGKISYASETAYFSALCSPCQPRLSLQA